MICGGRLFLFSPHFNLVLPRNFFSTRIPWYVVFPSFFFSQIPRILGPVAEAVRSLEEMALDPVLGYFVDEGWGGVENAKMAILSDFFKVRKYSICLPETGVCP